MPRAALDDQELVSIACQGDERALAELFERHRQRLNQMVRLRMDQRLQGRVDPSDIVQEAFLETNKRIQDYARKTPMPFFLWLRMMVGQKLIDAHRHHLGVKMRAAGREISLHRRYVPEATSGAIAESLLGSLTSPTQAVTRDETRRQIEAALDAMDEIDREVVSLRHFEGLSNSEVAQLLGISQAAASNRYMRALRRLKTVLTP
jgi:RNA polymerase sigma-70 factor (ECF subfamily)